jgi:hypothetical protein
MSSHSQSMDWDKLKVFHAAAEAGSFTHAGERLGLSQSAVSRHRQSLPLAAVVCLAVAAAGARSWWTARCALLAPETPASRTRFSAA